MIEESKCEQKPSALSEKNSLFSDHPKFPGKDPTLSELIEEQDDPVSSNADELLIVEAPALHSQEQESADGNQIGRSIKISPAVS